MRPLSSAEIIAVGSELLTASRLDTNSLAITERLRALGIALRSKTVVGDRRDDLAGIVRAALTRVDLVVLSGGLGPTDDDLTRDVVAAVLERPLVEDAGITATLRQRFADRGLTMPEINRRQAMVPAGAEVLPNPHGTAPGLYMTVADRVVVLLPGPPRELIPMLDGPVEQRLRVRTAGSRLYTRTVKIFGRGESHTEEVVRPFYPVWATRPLPIEVTILAARGAIDLLLTVTSSSERAAADALAAAVAEAVSVLGDDVSSDDGEVIEVVLGHLLLERGWKIAVAESCTAGLVMKRLTDVPGSSAYVEGGVVAYSNAVKHAQLGVPESLVSSHGAVSEPVAQAMAAGIRTLMDVEVGVAVTGIAGPSGGSDEKPVGTVVLAVDTPAGAVVRTKRYFGGRDLVRDISSHGALDMVRRVLTERVVR